MIRDILKPTPDKLGQGKTQKQLPHFGLILVGFGAILLGIAWYWLGHRAAWQDAFAYTSAEIAYNTPLQAVHEMGGTGFKPIPFLPKNGPQPKLVIPEVFHDFGNIGSQEVVTYDFVVMNRGDAPLTISRAYTTCGCTSASLTSAVIPPGKVSVVTLRFDAGFHDARGQTVRRGIIIENNDRAHPQAEFWVEASVRSTP